MKPAVIVDTNVLVAGLLTKYEQSPVARIVDGMLAANFAFVISEALLTEYSTVLARPKLRKLHGLSDADIDVLLIELSHHAIVLQPISAPPAPDPGDQLLWELLAVRPDLVLVTGNKLLLQSKTQAGRIITPHVFCDGWLGAGAATPK